MSLLPMACGALLFCGAGSALAVSPPSRDSRLDPVKECAAALPTGVPNDWQRIDLGSGLSFALPASCVEESSPQGFIHGGRRWHCEAVTVEVSWGYWGPESFGDGSVQCSTVLGGVPAMLSRRVSEAAPSLIVWYLTAVCERGKECAPGHEPIISAWSKSRDDAALVDGIALSGHRERSGAAN